MTDSVHMSHEELSAYVDGELPPVEATAVARHLTTCAHCSAEYQIVLDTVSLLRSELERYSAPDVLRARIRGAIAATPTEPVTDSPVPAVAPNTPRHASRSWTRPAAWAASLLLAAALGSGLTFIAASGNRGANSTADQVLASHVRSLMPDHLIDVRSSDQHNVKPWFNGRLDFSPTVPRLDEQGFPLVGGRVDYIGGRPVAVVVYSRRQHMINVFSWPSPGREEGLTASAANGYNMLHWRTAGTERWVASDLNAAELRSFVTLLERADSPPATGPSLAP
ncbi:MAG TPA: anti-sigma factor [Gemmatimonadaceae bacterium]|jgi:anti-sigma factor RsiW